MTTFSWFSGVQVVTILALVPALFGGVIADEKQRKTMHYLMASRLASGEIVLDKLAARLLHVGVFILLGLPVMSLLTLFGGVAWDYVVAAYAATVSITFFCGRTRGPHLDIRPARGAGCPDCLCDRNCLADRASGRGCHVPVACSPRFIVWIGPVSEWAATTTPLSLLIWTRRFSSGGFSAHQGPPGYWPRFSTSSSG